MPSSFLLPVRLALFDLDGTLIDSLADIGGAMNHALQEHGLPAHPIDAYRRFVGEGVHRLTERAVPPDRQELRAGVLATYQRYYAENLLVETGLFPGIPALLNALVERGVTLGVLSNKPDAATRFLADALLARWPFRAVQGERVGVPRKPDPTAALRIAAELGAVPGQSLFIGDSGIDMDTARAAGMYGVGVLWGLRDREELERSGARAVIAAPEELLGLPLAAVP